MSTCATFSWTSTRLCVLCLRLFCIGLHTSYYTCIYLVVVDLCLIQLTKIWARGEEVIWDRAVIDGEEHSHGGLAVTACSLVHV